MITMWRVKRGPFICFTSTIGIAWMARRLYPALKRARITNVIQALPEEVKLGRLYFNGELCPTSPGGMVEAAELGEVAKS